MPSTSKLANKLPNKITTFQIKCHSDDIKTHVFRNSYVRSFRTPFDLTQLDDDSSCLFQLMSGEAAKEWVTIAYTQVQSTSKLLANKLPNKISIKHPSDDIKTHVFRNSDVRSFRMPFDLATEEWPNNIM